MHDIEYTPAPTPAPPPPAGEGAIYSTARKSCYEGTGEAVVSIFGIPLTAAWSYWMR